MKPKPSLVVETDKESEVVWDELGWSIFCEIFAKSKVQRQALSKLGKAPSGLRARCPANLHLAGLDCSLLQTKQSGTPKYSNRPLWKLQKNVIWDQIASKGLEGKYMRNFKESKFPAHPFLFASRQIAYYVSKLCELQSYIASKIHTGLG